MSTTLPEDPRPVLGRPGRTGQYRRDRIRLARDWAGVVNSSTYIPLPYQQIEAELRDMVDRLFELVKATPFTAEPAAALGTRLVELNCVGPTSLRRSMEILGQALLEFPETRAVSRIADKVVLLLGALAAEYLAASNKRTLSQQEDLNRTLLNLTGEAQRAQWDTEARLAAVLASSTDAVLITDLDGKFLRTNEYLGELLDRTPDELAELTLFDVLSPQDVPLVREACEHLITGIANRLRHRRQLLGRGGETVPVSVTMSVLRNENGEPDSFVLVVQDETEVSLLQRQLAMQSLHDVLTGLPNRQYFTTQLERALNRADPRDGITVFHLDLDSFALVNDGLGRQVGDRLLKVVADRLKTVVASEIALVSRFDSDEFGLMVENSPHTPDVATMVDRITTELTEPVYLDGNGIAVSASIGVVHRPEQDVDPSEILRAADLTLRRAKAHGRGQWELFDAGQDALDRANFSLACTMAAAWELGEIKVVYRPAVRLLDGVPVRVHATLRWDHPALGPIPHHRCIELAEQTGLILPLGDWLLRSACAQLSQDSTLPLSICASAGQSVDADLVGRVLRILDDTGMPRHRLRLGLPVRMLLGERVEPLDNLKVLAEVGVGTMLDEFGGNAEELACLEDLPVDMVRICDRLVASQANRTNTNSAVGQALTNLVSVVHKAGGTVTVDGIDQPEQADWWRRAGADTALGDLFPS